MLVAAYRGVTRLMPAEYRKRHREAGVALLLRLLREAGAGGGAWRVSVVGLSAVVDALLRVPVEYIKCLRASPGLSTEGIGRDLRYAVRALFARPLASGAAIATLAVGIGLNAAVFSIIDWILLRPLPYPAPRELVRVLSSPAGATPGGTEVSYSEFTRLSSATALRASVAYSSATRVLAGSGLEPVHVLVARVSGDMCRTLGVYPAIGRAFDPREAASGAPAVILSDGLWRSRFAADRSVAGREVTLDGVAHTVVGVMPAGAGYPRDADLWRPVTAAEREDDDRENVMIARLEGGVTPERASGELDALARTASAPARRVRAEEMKQTDVRDVRLALTAVFASSALILLMACANVAALLGARGVERRAEMALRGALGASRGRLLRQLMTEHLVLAITGGVIGLVFGQWALSYLVSLVPQGLPRADEIVLDGRVIGFGVATTMIVGVLIGTKPARRASRADLQAALAAAGSGRATSRTSGRTLVALQTAVAIALTVSAVLLGRSLQYLVKIDDGFSADRLLAVDLYLRGTNTLDERELFRNLVSAAESLPGVRSAAVALLLPVRTVGPRVGVSVRGAEPVARPTKAVIRAVSSHYFETTGIPIIAGRGFTDRDTRTAPFVAVVNAAFVRDAMSGRAPVGATLVTELTDRPLGVVGVVGDLTPGGESDRPAFYVVSEQIRAPGGFLLVRTDARPAGLAPALAERLRTVAPALARDRIYPVADLLARGRAVPRFSMQLASGFAVLALALAAIGVYGLTASEVGSRWRELAIRLALGADRRLALWTVTRPSAVALAWGGVIGLAMAVGAARWMRALLHGVGPADLATFAAVPVVLALVSVAAVGLAVLRVLRADPAATLRRN
jgi:predicted permease